MDPDIQLIGSLIEKIDFFDIKKDSQEVIILVL